MNRRKFITSSATLGSIVWAGKYQFSESSKILKLASRTQNPALKTILPAWEGTPLDEKGCFMNHEYPNTNEFSRALKWMLQKNPQKKTKQKETWKMPIVKDDSFLTSSEDFIVFLGHATFFIRMAGKQILIDPIFGSPPMTKRFTEFPISTDKLVNIDYVLISHAHYDHCDKESLKILQVQNPNAKFLTGLKMESLIKKWVEPNEIQEAGWYQQYNLEDTVQIFYLPSRHWSNRSLGDANERLWGAFVLKSKDTSIYFGGDSGYGCHFKEVGELFPNLDVALIGAGAYSPRWFMSPNHQDPEHAIQAFKDTKAKIFIPFHYGTFDMADEPLSEPEKILGNLATAERIDSKLRIVKLGEAILLV